MAALSCGLVSPRAAMATLVNVRSSCAHKQAPGGRIIHHACRTGLGSSRRQSLGAGGRPETAGAAHARQHLGGLRQAAVALAAAGPTHSSSVQPPSQQPQSLLASIPAPIRLAALAAVCAACLSLMAAPQPGSSLFASLSLTAGSTSSITSEGLRTAVRSAGAGLAAGCLHTLAGADHLAALTPLTIGRSHLRASLLGALWGFGHSTGQLMLGLAMVLLKDRFTALVPALTKWGGTAVGLTLLAIGVLGIYESFFEEHHQEEADHPSTSAAAATSGAAAAAAAAAGQQQFLVQPDGTLAAAAAGMPSSSSSSAVAAGGKKEKRGFGLATFASGIAFGLQPDALFVIVPALTLPTKLAAAGYICMFVLGTVAAMGAYTGIIGFTSAAIKRNNSGLTQKLSGIASFVALAIGITVLAGGWGLELPFSLPFVGCGHH